MPVLEGTHVGLGVPALSELCLRKSALEPLRSQATADSLSERPVCFDVRSRGSGQLHDPQDNASVYWVVTRRAADRT